MLITPQVEPAPEQAATLGTALATCTLAFWSTDALPLLPATPEQPAEQPLSVLVYGGSTATGSIAIQLLRLSGLDPIATCSPHNFPLVRSRGASAVFDYTDLNIPSAIKKLTGGQLKYFGGCCIMSLLSISSIYRFKTLLIETLASLKLSTFATIEAQGSYKVCDNPVTLRETT